MHKSSAIVCFLLLSLVEDIYMECNAQDGPAGYSECVLLEPQYHKYQWATCLTDTYIKTYSKGRHLCANQTQTYCYYGCMSEIHNDQGSGPVFDDCACGRDAPTNFTTPVPVSTLAIPEWCFSPPGTNCSWYRSCLEMRYPCNQEKNSYALDYAEKFCKLYTENYKHFTAKGQEWIDAVRKCLQVNLVPILRPFVHKSCDEIKKIAFDSHPGCYVNPGADEPSFCDIGVINMWWVFWTIKGALLDAPNETFTEFLKVAFQCFWDKALSEVEMTALEFVMPEVRVVADAVKAVSTLMSTKRRWKEKGLFNYAFSKSFENNEGKRDTDKQNVTYVIILLASKAEHDLNAENAPPANATEEAKLIAKAIENGNLTLDLPEGMKVTALNICRDYNCTETVLSVVVPETHYLHDKSPNSVSTIIIIICSTVGGMFIAIGIVYGM